MFLGGLLTTACSQPPLPRSYLALPLQEDGKPAQVPHVVRGRHCGASILAVGVLHGRDPTNPQFAQLESLYRDFEPTLVLHENVTPVRPASDREGAIRRNGEIGFMQFLTAEDGVPFRSGDLPEATEFRSLIALSEPLQLLVFLTGQRLLTGLGDEAVAASEYPGFYSDYLVANGFPNREEWSTWIGFRSAYRAVIGTHYDPANFDPELFSPIRDHGPLNELSRRGHRARDSHLMRQVARAAAEGHQRIMIVFGAWHVLALEPVIRFSRRCHPSAPSSPLSIRP